MKEFLSQRGVPYLDRDVSNDRAGADEMIRKSGQLGVPVIDIDGQIVIGFDVPKLESLLAQRAASGVRFGLSVADAAAVAQKQGLPPALGAYVGRVVPSSAGDRAGLREGDIITDVNLQPIRGADDLQKALSALSRGSTVSLSYLRDSEKRMAEVVV